MSKIYFGHIHNPTSFSSEKTYAVALRKTRVVQMSQSNENVTPFQERVVSTKRACTRRFAAHTLFFIETIFFYWKAGSVICAIHASDGFWLGVFSNALIIEFEQSELYSWP